MTMTLGSAAFAHGGEIPARHTCEGQDRAPPLAWTDVPEAARSLVLIVDDPDAPDPEAPQTTWVHWVLYNLPPDVRSLPEGAGTDSLPSGTREGINSWQRRGYGGPCPPIGRHRYFHKLYALDCILPLMHDPCKAGVEAAMNGHVIARAELIGTYRKTG